MSKTVRETSKVITNMLTTRKLHVCFRLASRSMNLADLDLDWKIMEAVASIIFK